MLTFSVPLRSFHTHIEHNKLLPIGANKIKRQTPMLRQRNIQIQAMNSLDRATTDDEEDALKETFRKRTINFEEKSSEDESQIKEEPNSDDSLETYLVIIFNNDVNSKSLHWIVDKIRGKRTHGGAELLIRKEPQLE